MATNKPSDKAGTSRAKKPRNAATDGMSPESDTLESDLGDASGATRDGALSKRGFENGAVPGGQRDGAAHDGLARDGALRNGRSPSADGATRSASDAGSLERRPLKISTVSHTLDAAVADRLRHFAFRERISESAVIEFALRELFSGAPEDVALGKRLREAGAALRRKA